MTYIRLPVFTSSFEAVAALVWLVALGLSTPLAAADWPTYRHDNQRSAITAESLKLPLVREWEMTPPQPPAPAWAKPAKFDFYVSPQSQKPLVHRLAYDLAYYVSAVGDSVFYGSSGEHAVICLHARTGQEKWSFFTDAPVRMTPTIHEGHVYAGSDDGSVYCLDDDDGSLIWQYTAAGRNNFMIPNDGRLVSPWAVRSSVAVDNGTAYFSSGFLPHEGVYLSAVNALTGKRTAKHHWLQKFINKGALQGYILLSGNRVYMPGGRSTPYFYDRTTGRQLGQYAKGTGMGTFALLTDDRLIFGPADRSGGVLTEASTGGGDKLASHTDAVDLIVATETVYLLKSDSVVAMSRNKRFLWSKSLNQGCSLALAGSTLFVGSTGKVQAMKSNGRIVFEKPVPGRALGLAVANNRLLVSTDTGAIVSFTPEGTQKQSAWVLY